MIQQKLKDHIWSDNNYTFEIVLIYCITLDHFSYLGCARIWWPGRCSKYFRAVGNAISRMANVVSFFEIWIFNTLCMEKRTGRRG